jgi:hypothetical protein
MPKLSLNTAAAQNGTADFTVGPEGGVFFLGTNAVVFPKGSICDPAVSSYGPGTWDDACTPLTSPTRIHAETRVTDGRTSIDFSPALRFVPTNDPAKYVWIYMYTPAGTTSTNPDLSTIYYSSTIGGVMHDESVNDTSLRTYVDSQVSIRRIKHFSGYTVYGRSCDMETSPPGTCFEMSGQ